MTGWRTSVRSRREQGRGSHCRRPLAPPKAASGERVVNPPLGLLEGAAYLKAPPRCANSRGHGQEEVTLMTRNRLVLSLPLTTGAWR